MSDVWSERADLYRDSEAHRGGPDLDVLVDWAFGSETVLDVATGGGHVARRLREAGLQVVTCDPAVGMQPDVVCRAEELPFADASFDAVTCRLGAHHFEEVARAVGEMRRVARFRVLVVDNLFADERMEEAEVLRDPSHVRTYTDLEWRELFAGAGLLVDDVRHFVAPIEVEPWLERTGCTGDEAARVRELVAHRTRDRWLELDRIAIKGVVP